MDDILVDKDKFIKLSPFESCDSTVKIERAFQLKLNV